MTLQKMLTWLFMLMCYLSMSVDVSAQVVIDWVTVGDPGNLEHTVEHRDGTSGYGAMGYTFQIGELEITNDQHIEFLNAVADTDPNQLYHFAMGSSVHGGVT